MLMGPSISLWCQRNVGILEKIVQSLIAKQARGLPSVDDELEMQFNAQVDVLAQLEQKLQKQLEGAKGTTWIKLQRDLERVQGRAKGLQESVARMRKNAKHAPPPSTDGMTQQEAFEYQQQLQLQEDVSKRAYKIHFWALIVATAAK